MNNFPRLATIACILIAGLAPANVGNSMPAPNDRATTQADPEAAPLRVLFFTGTTDNGHRHEEALQVAKNLGEQMAELRGWSLTFSEDLNVWSTLSEYDVVILMNCGKSVVQGGELRSAFLEWLRAGGGVVSFHYAAFIGRNWSEANRVFLGATHARQVENLGEPTIDIDVDTSHPSTAGLQTDWTLKVEVYPWDSDPQSRGFVPLLTVSGLPNPASRTHPLAWFKDGSTSPDIGLGRAWHSNLGHFAQTYYEPNFIRMFTHAVEWAGGSSEAAVFELPAPKQEPFMEMLTRLPGRVEVERFDVGGSGVSYRDTTPGNSFDELKSHLQLRETDVDVHEKDELRYITDIVSEEWVEQTVAVPSGTYDILLRGRNGTTDDRVRVLESGSHVADLAVPASVNWSTTTTRNVRVTGGERTTLRFQFSGSGFDLDWIEFKAVATSTDLEEESGNPELAWVLDAYPNPLHSDTGEATIMVTRPPGFHESTSADVDVSVFDLLGRRVATLFRGALQPQRTISLPIRVDLPGGVYLITLSSVERSVSTTFVVAT